jgi:GTPase SAR1 family protein
MERIRPIVHFLLAVNTHEMERFLLEDVRWIFKKKKKEEKKLDEKSRCCESR